MKIENATEKDIQRIIEIDKEAFGEDAITKLTVKSQLKALPEGAFVAKENNQVVGVAFCERHSEETFPFYDHDVLETHKPNGNLLYISAITIAKDFRNKGVGSKLLGEISKLAKKLGITRIYCPVNKEHPYLKKGVLHFWQKNGYRITGGTSWEISPNRFLEAFVFEKTLN